MDKKILILGSGGQLGTALYKVLTNEYRVIALTSKELDITDQAAVNKPIQKEKPNYVINAAAFNKVDMAEVNPAPAFLVNALGPYYLALAAKHGGAIFVHISTDYVFGGNKDFFTETDAPRPLNVYGASKFSGEQLVEIASGPYYIIR